MTILFMTLPLAFKVILVLVLLLEILLSLAVHLLEPHHWVTNLLMPTQTLKTRTPTARMRGVTPPTTEV